MPERRDGPIQSLAGKAVDKLRRDTAQLLDLFRISSGPPTLEDQLRASGSHTAPQSLVDEDPNKATVRLIKVCHGSLKGFHNMLRHLPEEIPPHRGKLVRHGDRFEYCKRSALYASKSGEFEFTCYPDEGRYVLAFTYAGHIPKRDNSILIPNGLVEDTFILDPKSAHYASVRVDTGVASHILERIRVSRGFFSSQGALEDMMRLQMKLDQSLYKAKESLIADRCQLG